jgi:hypothetical protein
MACVSESYFSWIWVALVMMYGTCIPALGDAREPGPTLVFRIINDGLVAQEVVESAKAYVEHIYGNSGIKVEWFNENQASQAWSGNGKLELTMVFAPNSMAQIINRPKEATGFAVSNDGQGPRRAYIFVEQVAEQANVVHSKRSLGTKKAKALILGYVMAHEAGHLMLPHGSHSPLGIMQARFGMDSVELAKRGNLFFTPDQARQIRTVVLSRNESN